MGRIGDKLVGKRFGELTVVERVGSNKYGNILWRCECTVCGNTDYITQTSGVKSGGSCGCLRGFQGNGKAFSIVDTESAYWAGFIGADGCISNNSVDISLGLKDMAHLEKLAEFLGIPNRVRTGSYLHKGTKKRYERCSISVGSSIIVADLLKYYNIGPNKTHNFGRPSKLAHEHALAYVAGLLDGDGWVSSNRAKKQNKSSYDPVEYNYTDTIGWCGTEDILQYIKEIIAPYHNGTANIRHYTNTKIIKRLQINGRNATALIKLFAALAAPRLERKLQPVYKV